MYKLLQGDCIELMKKIPDKSVDLIITDPPYWHNKSSSLPTAGEKTMLKNDLYARDSKMISQMSEFNPNNIVEFLNEAKRVMKIMNCYLFCNDSQIATYGKWAEENKCNFSVLTWRKPLSIINTNRFSQNAEFICRIYRNGTGLNYVDNKDYYDRVINDKPLRGKNKLHPTQKPVSIIERFVMLSSKEDGLILDPFMGSGSTGEAALINNRNFIGMELDEKYFNIAKERIENIEKDKVIRT